MKYKIDDDYGGVPEGFRYEIEDTPENEADWKCLIAAFESEFSELKRYQDYDFADWHYGRRSIFASLYNENFYNARFIPRIQHLLRNADMECFGKFECFDSTRRLIGHVMVFTNNVIFSRLAEATGLLAKLAG